MIELNINSGPVSSLKYYYTLHDILYNEIIVNMDNNETMKRVKIALDDETTSAITTNIVIDGDWGQYYFNISSYLYNNLCNKCWRIEGTNINNQSYSCWLYIIPEEHGIYLWDADSEIINGYLNYEKSAPALNTTSTVVQTLNSKTPFIVNNIEQEYYTGTISATFVEEWEDNEWGYDFETSYNYRFNLKKWFTNKKPKILFFADGRKFIIIINSDITESFTGNINNVITTFNWTEIDEYNIENLNKYELNR